MTSNTRTSNTIRNMVVGFASRVIFFLLPFAIRTIIIHRLGADYVGLGSLFTSVLQVLSVAELGLSSAIVFSLYKPVADNNIAAIQEWLSLYKYLYYIIGTIILLAGMAMLPILSFFIKGDYSENINIYVLYMIYLSNTVLSYYGFAYKNVVLIVNQRKDILSGIEIVITIIRSIIQIVVLLASNNYYFYILFLPVFTMVSNIVLEIITRKRYPDYVCGKKMVKFKKLREVSDQIKGVAIGRLSLVARNAFDSVILSVICGLGTVTIYSNYYYIFQAVTGVLTVVLTSMAASVGNSLVTETVEKNYKDHNKFDFYFMWLCGWCTICMACLYQHFMYLWVGVEYLAPFSTMVLFCIYFYSNKLSEIRALYSEAAGLWWKFRYVTVGEMVANICLNVVLGYFWQMNGVLIATIITSFVSSFLLISQITFKEYFRTTIREYYRNNMVYFLATVVVSVITYIICMLVSEKGVIGFIMKLMICAVVPNVIYLITYLTVPMYRDYLTRLKNGANMVIGKRWS